MAYKYTVKVKTTNLARDPSLGSSMITKINYGDDGWVWYILDPLKFFAGTNDDVHVYIEGNVGFARTKLDNFLHNDFESGCTDKFDFTVEGYLGEIQKVELSKNGSDEEQFLM